MKGQAVLLTAAGIGMTLALLLGGSLLGPAGTMFNLLTPVAAVYLGMRFGLPTAAVVVVVVSLLLSQLAPLYSLAAYLALFGTGSLLLPLLLRRELPWDRAVLFAALGETAVMLALVTVVVVGGETAYPAVIGQLVQAEVDQAIQIYREAGFTDSQLQEMQGLVEQIGQFIQQTFYGLYLAGALAIQLLSLLFLQWLKRNDYQVPGVQFARWRLPAFLVWVLIAAGFGLLAPLPSLNLLGRNLLAVLLPLYFLQGLAVVNSFLRRKKYPPVLKGLIYLMVFILNPLPIIITGVGLFDLWVDFRRPRKKDI
jgi:uncharacterized protein YybS (DUF2232 family)